MADDADIANDRADSEREYRIAEARRNAPAVEYHTNCKWCGDPTENGAAYDCCDCRDDYQKFMSAQKRGGAV